MNRAPNMEISDNKNPKNNDIKKLNEKLKLMVLLQTIIIVLLMINIVLFLLGLASHEDLIDDATNDIINAEYKEAVINAGEGIDLDIESVGDSSIDYSVGLSLNNTGNREAKVSVTGEVYISEMGSATGDEMTTVLKYIYVEISPDRTRDLDLGTFIAYEGWHYVVKVHISWNGGSLELSEMLIPTP